MVDGEARSEASRRWSLIADLAERLAADDDLAEEFERTPGKVLRRLGVADHDVAGVLTALQRARQPGGT
jgi:hypothetical protein